MYWFKQNQSSPIDYFVLSFGCLVFNAQNLPRLVERTGCPKKISKSRMDRFNKLWSGSDQRVMGLDGNLRYTRGLGYSGEGLLENSSLA
jgi:hypothetical protein